MPDPISRKLTRGSRRYNLSELDSASQIVETNLVLYLDAGNINSYNGVGTTWYDLSTGNHTCTLVNGPVFSSNNGGYFDFDGVYDYGTIPNSSDFYFGTAEFTVEVWAMTEDISEDYQILGGNHNAGIGGGWFFYGDDTNGTMAFGNTTQVDDTVFTQSQDTWYHFAVRRDANGFDFFRNNSAGSANLAFNDNIANNNLPLIIGNLHYFGVLGQHDILGWNGRIAQVRAYNRALSDAELTQNYNAHKSRYGL